MKKDKNGYTIETGNYLIVKTETEELVCKIYEDDNSNDACFEVHYTLGRIAPINFDAIDLGMYSSEQLEIITEDVAYKLLGIS